jgi:hypothetical protein
MVSFTRVSFKNHFWRFIRVSFQEYVFSHYKKYLLDYLSNETRLTEIILAFLSIFGIIFLEYFANLRE